MGTSREKVLAFVRQRLMEGRSPTVREVQAALGFRAVQSAKEHLDKLVAEGKLSRASGVSRGYRLPELEDRRTSLRLVPILGRVQAGLLSPAAEDHEGYVPLETRRLGGGKSHQDPWFALKVRGESMTGVGILPGDLVIVRRQSTASSGDIVVALVGDEATVKTLRMKPGCVELHPANPDFETIVIKAPEEVSILGKVVEVRRSLDEVHG